MPLSLTKSFCRSTDDASKQLRDFAYQWREERIDQIKNSDYAETEKSGMIAQYSEDCDDILKIVDALSAGDIGKAQQLRRSLDTFVSDIVPEDVAGFLALHSTAGKFIGMLPEGKPADTIEQFAVAWLHIVERLETVTRLQCIGFYPEVCLGFYTSSGHPVPALRCDGDVAHRIVTNLEIKTADAVIT